MAEILVTGGAGFIGGHFVRQWCARSGGKAVVLDALTYAASPASIADVTGAELVVGDIRDTALVRRLLRERGIRTLVHFAAETHVDRSIAGAEAFVATNVVGTHSLLEAAKAEWLDAGASGPHRFHHISSDEVFGSLGVDEPPVAETAAYAPNSPYAASKAGADHLVRAYHRTYGLDTVITHSSNSYGPYQFPEKLVPLTIAHALEGRALTVYGDGFHRREWLHVEDHCRGILCALERGKPGESYNLGGAQERTNREVVTAICDAVDRVFAQDPGLADRFPAAPAAGGGSTATLTRFVADRKGHDRRYALDGSKARAELGYFPETGFAGGLERTLAWYLANPDWWRPLLARQSS